MNIFIKQVLEGVMKIILGYKSWGKVKSAVAEMANTALTGDEKKALVIVQLRETGLALANSFLNLAIEVAVALITKKAVEFVSDATE